VDLLISLNMARGAQACGVKWCQLSLAAERLWALVSDAYRCGDRSIKLIATASDHSASDMASIVTDSNIIRTASIVSGKGESASATVLPIEHDEVTSERIRRARIDAQRQAGMPVKQGLTEYRRAVICIDDAHHLDGEVS
jgi:hypothetical protein